jgi:hypothetical protein
LKQFSDKPRAVLVTKEEIGVDRAKNNIVRLGARGAKAKPVTLRDTIKSEAKQLGIRRMDMNKFLHENVGAGDLKTKWAEFKNQHKLNQSLHTRAGRKDRREAFAGLKAAAIAMGLDKRGQRGWNAFLSSKPGLEEAALDTIETELTLWMKKKYSK